MPIITTDMPITTQNPSLPWNGTPVFMPHSEAIRVGMGEWRVKVVGNFMTMLGYWR